MGYRRWSCHFKRIRLFYTKQEPAYNTPSMKNNFFIAGKNEILDKYVHKD